MGGTDLAWLKGEHGAHVEGYQRDLVALGYDLPQSTRRDGSFDGVVGAEVLGVTDRHMRENFGPLAVAAGTIPLWARLYVHEAAEARRFDRILVERNTGLAHIGAWAGRAAVLPSSWRAQLDVATAMGLTEVSLMLNDCTGRMVGGRWKQRLDWHMFAAPDQVATVVRAYRDAGIRVCLTSWLRPDLAFLDAMFSALYELAERTGAERAEGDAEEPFTTRRYADHDKCRALIAERVKTRPCAWGVTAIVYHHRELVGPLVELADFVRLQAYATSRQTARHLYPGAIVKTAAGLMAARYGVASLAKLEPAVAFYDRAGAGGLSAPAAVRADFEAIERLVGVHATSGWSLASLTRPSALRSEVQRWCAALRAGELARAGA